jgi:hypothetical protein
MRKFALVLTIGLFTATAANAAPTISLTWTSTTGTGATGGNQIYALPGDTLRLIITAHADPNGLSFAGVSLVWDAGDFIGFNAVECPAPENALGPGVCTDGGVAVPPTFVPFAPGVNMSAGSASSFDAGGLPPAFVTSIIVGSIEFVVGATATIETVSVYYSPGSDSVNDGLGNVFFPTAFATNLIPEPGSATLLSLGLITIGIARRRRG